MSGLEGLQLDPDGFVDMDQFPDDGTDLAEADLAQLRATLHADPVEEPTAAEWDAMFDEVVAADDGGPFAVDDGTDLDGTLADGEPSATDDLSTDDLSEDLSTDDDPVDGDADLASDGLDPADPGTDLDAFEVDLDGGLDLATDGGLDDAFPTDVADDGGADVAGGDFEDLL